MNARRVPGAAPNPYLRLYLFSFSLALAAWTLPSLPVNAAEPADRTGPPSTHGRASINLPGEAVWLIPARAGRRNALFALMKDGVFHRLSPVEGMTPAKSVPAETLAGGVTPARNRLRAERLRVKKNISSRVPPVNLGSGVIAGPGKDGSLIVIDLFAEKTVRAASSRKLSPLSRPASLSPRALAAVGRDGSIILFEKTNDSWKETQRLSNAEALGDGILTGADMDGDGWRELIVAAAPTGRYGHGVLGDAIEPSEVRVYKLDKGRLKFVSAYAVESGVFESIGALSADLDGDGREEILITRSGLSSGAAHLALALRAGKLTRLAAGNAIGQAFRWSHLLGAFDMGEKARTIIAIETPHLAGYLLALELRGNRLAERARRPGFTTHAIGSRNLWQYATIKRGGAREIVVPVIGGGRLAALALNKNRWTLRWTLPLTSPVRSNIAASDLNGDGLDDLAFIDEKGVIQAILSR